MDNAAIYAGSFDPFTNGHLDIVKQASKLFDKVYIISATNTNRFKGSKVKEIIEYWIQRCKELETTIESKNK